MLYSRVSFRSWHRVIPDHDFNKAESIILGPDKADSTTAEMTDRSDALRER